MRIKTADREYIFTCKCGLQLAYNSQEIDTSGRCPQCGSDIVLSGLDDIYEMRKLKLVYPANRRIEKND